jgi:hypothetical protein
MSKRHASGGDMAERSKPRAIPIISPDRFRNPNGGRIRIATAGVSNLRRADDASPRSA